MKTIPAPTDKKDIEAYHQRKFCLELLGYDLVPSDSHDEEGAMMTENQAWYFVPCDDDFVMSQITIANPEPQPTNRKRWRVEWAVVQSNYPHGPDDYDLGEVGERSDSLMQAIKEASLIAHKVKIQNIGEGLFWEMENLKEKLGYYKY